ncbi:hypothetical protein L6164_018340 [Bauhinia variegata]|uniref:Uncharacterized protein n=1 Tax=Bauhinia variegata TaxID=167791 RepID=A0ACB9NC55_BAUVA|nr:hypothetical protein L6164_018340 [Bauhinia variegata]
MGVGGWSSKGVDAGIYARELIANCASAMDNQSKGNVNPKKVLEEAYLKTKARGSSTACILTLTDQRILKAAHVGDSGFWLFRNNMIVGQSQIQQRSFNRPYQLGNERDRPNCAIKTQFSAIPGDVVVLGTDGLLDNLYPSQIEDVLREKDGESLKPEELACTIAELAYYTSMDNETYSPFARASEMAGRLHNGGKIDDITVIVACITEPN